MYTIDQNLKDLFYLSNLNLFSENKILKIFTEYLKFTQDKKIEFLKRLSHDYYIDRKYMAKSLMDLSGNLDNETIDAKIILNSEDNLRKSLVPQYSYLFKHLSKLSNGVKILVDLRADLLELSSVFNLDSDPMSPYLKCMNNTMKELLQIWFSVGLMDVERITWQSSCDMLQKISEYEAVHPMKNWTDLKRRVGSYRRCFAFTHKSMPGEPIVVLHVALTHEISNSIQAIVSHPRFNSLQIDSTSTNPDVQSEDHSLFDTAIFYSISSTQKGLQNVELGNYLIKRVTAKLKKEFPNIHKFSSLSPIPGFKKWLLQCIDKVVSGQAQNSSEVILLNKAFTKSRMTEALRLLPLPPTTQTPGTTATTLREEEPNDISLSFWTRFLHLLQDPKNRWTLEPKYSPLLDMLEEPFTKLCAHYICDIKSNSGDGSAQNSVANFHFRNGATFWRINWMADRSVRGLDNAWGMMINYRYFLDQIEANSVQYTTVKVISTSESIKNRLRYEVLAPTTPQEKVIIG